jgi:hypothetical protein
VVDEILGKEKALYKRSGQWLKYIKVVIMFDKSTYGIISKEGQCLGRNSRKPRWSTVISVDSTLHADQRRFAESLRVEKSNIVVPIC